MSHRFVPVIVVALTAFSSAAAQDDPWSLGQPPQFFIVIAVKEESLVIQRRPPPTKEVDVPPIVYQPAFKTLRATDAKGKTLKSEDVIRRVKVGSVVLVSPDDQPVNRVFLTVIKDDTVILFDIIPRSGATGATVVK